MKQMIRPDPTPFTLSWGAQAERNTEPWNPVPYVVLLEDSEGARKRHRVDAASGKLDAFNQAKHDNPGWYAIEARPE